MNFLGTLNFMLLTLIREEYPGMRVLLFWEALWPPFFPGEFLHKDSLRWNVIQNFSIMVKKSRKNKLKQLVEAPQWKFQVLSANCCIILILSSCAPFVSKQTGIVTLALRTWTLLTIACNFWYLYYFLTKATYSKYEDDNKIMNMQTHK